MKLDSPEAEAAKSLVANNRVQVLRDETVAGLRLLAGKVENRDAEVLINADGKVTRGQCNCSHYYQFKPRGAMPAYAGPTPGSERREDGGDGGTVVPIVDGNESMKD